MAVAQRLRDLVTDLGAANINSLTGAYRAGFLGDVNYGTADLRFDAARTQIITLNSFGGTDSFKVRVVAKAAAAGGTGSSGSRDAGNFAVTDTAAFVRGTNAAASDLQTALRTATGDTGLTVSGTTDAGPYTVTYTNRGQCLLELVGLSGCSGNVTRGVLAYDDPNTSTPASSGVAGNGINFDPEGSRGFQNDVPLGHSIVSDGTGQTRGTVLAVPTMVSAVGGSGQVVVDTTEVASGGTNAVVLFSILKRPAVSAKVDNRNWVVETQGVALEDADGDLTATGLTAGEYALAYCTQTEQGRVSQPAPLEYFTVT
jgi:hypothetical protein